MVYAIVAFSPGRASNAAFAVTRNSRHGKSLMTLWSHLYSSWVHSSAHDMSMYLFVYVLDLFLLKLEYTSLLRIGSFVTCSAEVTFWYSCLLVNSNVSFHLSPAAFSFCIGLAWFLVLSTVSFFFSPAIHWFCSFYLHVLSFYRPRRTLCMFRLWPHLRFHM